MSHHKFQQQIIYPLLFVTLFVFSFTTNTAAQKSRRIEMIDVHGNRRLSDEEILKHIKTRSNQQLDEKQLQEDLQSLMKLGVFNTTHTKVITEEGMRGGVNVFFQVYELPLIVELKFEGLRYMTLKEISTQLCEQKAEVKVGTPYRPEKLFKARQVIADYLIKRGFIDAKASVSDEEVSATTLIIRFVIDELPNDDEEECCEN